MIWYTASSKQIRCTHLLLFQCWASAEDGGPTLKQHWARMSRVCWDIPQGVSDGDAEATVKASAQRWLDL